jgi:hypothetical protein
MSGRIRFLCGALIVPVILGSSHVAMAQGYGGRFGFFDSGIGAFGGGTYPGRAFGFDPRYLASRTFTAGGRARSVTYGTPQPSATEGPRFTAALARAATTTACSPDDFIQNGETAFRCGDYLGAIEDWKQALAAAPRNPVLLMMLSQAFFAAGNYQEAAATTQTAMHALPQDRWGVVVSNRRELYGNPNSYLHQLQQLETSVNDNPKDPAQRFLLAFQYAYLGYPQPAVAQLDKVVELEPRDEMAVLLRDAIVPLLPEPGAPVITPGVVTPARGLK